MAKTAHAGRTKPTFAHGRRCVLCNQPIADTTPSNWCCGDNTYEQVLITVDPTGRQETFTLTRTRVMPGGYRRWAGRGEDGRLVIWDERAA